MGKKGRVGSIVNVASIAGLAGSPGLGPYAVGKAGVVELTLTAANTISAALPLSA